MLPASARALRSFLVRVSAPSPQRARIAAQARSPGPTVWRARPPVALPAARVGTCMQTLAVEGIKLPLAKGDLTARKMSASDRAFYGKMSGIGAVGSA